MPESATTATTAPKTPTEPPTAPHRNTVGFGAVPRRIALGGGLAAVAGLVVACGGQPPAASNAGGADAGGDGGTAGFGSGSDGSIVALDSIPVGEAVATTIAGKPAVVARPTATTVTAFSAICTHMGCTVNVDGAQLRCPCHGSQYNALTGAVTHGPAPRNLPEIAVKVSDGQVLQA
jgi:nitrite reductase/ring-hydroxylating ferredoxin subunit